MIYITAISNAFYKQKIPTIVCKNIAILKEATVMVKSMIEELTVLDVEK